MRLQEIAEKLGKENFLGGPTEFFEVAGRLSWRFCFAKDCIRLRRSWTLAAVVSVVVIG